MPTEDASVLQQIHSLLDRRVDGIVLRPSGDAKWESHLHEAVERQVPVVSVDTETQAENHRIDFVGTDDFNGGRLVAQRFLAAGHRHLAVITTGGFGDPMQSRRSGFESGVTDQQDATCVCITQPWVEFEMDSPNVALRLLGLEPRPTAIFVTMDKLAVGVFNAAKQLGLRIPQDLSVVGFADEPLAARLSPGLTTLRQQPLRIGQLSAELLLERIRTKDTQDARKRILIEPDWVERESLSEIQPTP